jgi:hypothetical protein
MNHVMVIWRDTRGATVGQVSQGLAMTSAGPRAAYFAQTVVGALSTGFPRFTCAVREVEKRLGAARIRASRTI